MKKHKEIDVEVSVILADLVDRLELEYRYSNNIEQLIKQSKRLLRARYFPLSPNAIDEEQALARKTK